MHLGEEVLHLSRDRGRLESTSSDMVLCWRVRPLVCLICRRLVGFLLVSGLIG